MSDAPTEERIRCGSYADSLVLGSQQELLALLARERKGLLVVDRLSSFHGRHGHGEVRLRRGEVDHDLDLGIGQKLVDRAGTSNAMGFGLCLGPLGDEISARGDLQDLERLLTVLQVDAADVPATDDAVFVGFTLVLAIRQPPYLLAQSRPRFTISNASGTSKSFATWPREA